MTDNITKSLNGRLLRLLIGGSPCTYWSIAKNNRETQAEGLGWELFENYLIAKEKFKPDYFLYENNKSAAQGIKDQISKELGVDLQYIDSSLVSPQKRQRFYAHNILGVDQPRDREICLADILESGTVWLEKSYALTNRCSGAIISDTLMCRQDGGVGAKAGLYIAPAFPFGTNNNNKAHCMDANYWKGSNPKQTLEKHRRTMVAELLNFDLSQYENIIIRESGNIEIDGKIIYCIRDEFIWCKNEKYKIDLPDGYYTIRKLTPVECERLQTMPDGYTDCVSNSQRYKCLGNGWTAEVIIHILSHIDLPKNYPIEVLSMYDGIATGRYCLDKLGYTNITYKAYEIDKYAIQVAMKNYPGIIQCGDAFKVREDNWLY